MINHPHSCPRFEFCSRYHSFCANFSQWKVSPGRKNRASAAAHVTRIEFAFSFLTRGENIISGYRVGFISTLDYIGRIIFFALHPDEILSGPSLFMPIYFQSIKKFQ